MSSSVVRRNASVAPKPKRRGDCVEIVRLDGDVTIGEYDDVVAGALRHVNQIADLEVASVHARIDHEFDIALRMRGLQTPHYANRRIDRRVHTEQELKARVGLLAERHEVFVQARLDSAQWFEYADGLNGEVTWSARARRIEKWHRYRSDNRIERGDPAQNDH